MEDGLILKTKQGQRIEKIEIEVYALQRAITARIEKIMPAQTDDFYKYRASMDLIFQIKQELSKITDKLNAVAIDADREAILEDKWDCPHYEAKE